MTKDDLIAKHNPTDPGKLGLFGRDEVLTLMEEYANVKVAETIESILDELPNLNSEFHYDFIESFVKANATKEI